ncbi:LPXTG cell wall anchor domain-containing protein [Oribacterium sp. WCC10]|uniref:LPXTG cell wall anchor domain-containing protein n=1 Tax=Oribacterium sp. WCC10 TaxID=1855343 RepID=UPI0008F1B7AB|nr:LPXTG cell wall anchor domain-containing protein [Oribacterium sp. WCC10]SFG63257.1 LPXTG-motif cell wall anchor domain-containing protein [Oribacterium sp. WCC10]
MNRTGFSNKGFRQFMSLFMATVIILSSIIGDVGIALAVNRDDYINRILEQYDEGELSRDEALRQLVRNGMKDSPVIDFGEDSDGNTVATASNIAVKMGEADKKHDEKILERIDKLGKTRNSLVYVWHKDDVEKRRDVSTKSELKKESSGTADTTHDVSSANEREKINEDTFLVNGEAVVQSEEISEDVKETNSGNIIDSNDSLNQIEGKKVQSEEAGDTTEATGKTSEATGETDKEKTGEISEVTEEREETDEISESTEDAEETRETTETTGEAEEVSDTTEKTEERKEISETTDVTGETEETSEISEATDETEETKETTEAIEETEGKISETSDTVGEAGEEISETTEAAEETSDTTEVTEKTKVEISETSETTDGTKEESIGTSEVTGETAAESSTIAAESKDETSNAIDLDEYLTFSSTKRLSRKGFTEVNNFDSGENIYITLFFNIPEHTLSTDDCSVAYSIPEGLKAAKKEKGKIKDEDRTVGSYSVEEDVITITFDRTYVKSETCIEGAFYFKAEANIDTEDDEFTVELGTYAGSINICKSLTQTAISDDGRVSVTASYGVSSFDKEVTLKATELRSEEMKDAEDTFNDLLKNENRFVKNMYSYDISFVDEEGNEVEPDGNVSINMEFVEPVVTEDNAGLKLFHIENNDLSRVEDLTESSDTQVTGDDEGSVREISFTAETLSPFVMVETGVDGRNLLTNVSIEGARSDDGKTWVVENGETYKLTLKFEETNQNQFPYDDTWMVYHIPEGLYVEDQSRYFTIVIDGKYVISENRLIVKAKERTVELQWNTKSPNFSHLLNSTNVEIEAGFKGYFNKNSKKIVFSDSITREIKIDDSAKVDVYKSGYYDANDKKIHYTVTLYSKGTTRNIQAVDELVGKALSLDTDSIKIYGNNDAKVTKADSKGFTVLVPKMSNGETANINYTASVDFDQIAQNGHATFSETGNNVTVKILGRDDESKSCPVENVTFSSLVKYGSVEVKTAKVRNDAINSNGISKNMTWTIEANKERVTRVSYIKDSIDEKSRSNMRYSGKGISVLVTFEDGRTETREIPWESLERPNDYEWKWYPPISDGKASYKVTYTTSVNIPNGTSDLKVKNHAETDHSSNYDEVKVTPGNNTNITASKHATDVNVGEVSWTIHVNVPAGGADKLHIVDTLPNVWINNVHKFDEFYELTGVYGLSDSESYKLDKTTETLTFTFYKDRNKTTEGLNSTVSERTITVIYKTKNNKDWMDYAEDSGNGHYREHNNEATIKLGTSELKVNAKAYPSRESLKKQGAYYSTDNGRLVYSYDLVLGGVTHGNVTIDDYFDTKVLSYMGKSQYNNDLTSTAARIYGGNQYDCGDDTGEKADVDVTQTDSGIIKIHIGDFPKQSDGSYYGYYRIRYYLSVNESDAIQSALANGGETVFKNIAYWATEKSEVNITYEHNPVKKGYKWNEDGDGMAKYTITINSGKEKLNNGDAMVLEDEFENQIIDISTIKITAKDKENKDRVSEIKYSLSGNVLTFDKIPDETAIEISYKAVPVFKENTVTLKNKATLMTFESITEFDAEFDSWLTGNGSIPKIKIVKYKEGDVQTKLSGAVFDLYIVKEDGAREFLKAFSTGEDGEFTVELDHHKDGNEMFFNQEYCLVESRAPDGYHVNSDNAYYFTICDGKDSNVKLDYNSDRPVYASGYVLSISNSPGLVIELPITGGTGTTMMYFMGMFLVLLGGFAIIKRRKF